MGKLVPRTSALFVCDVQEKFRPVITGYPTVVDTAERMVSTWDIQRTSAAS